MESPSKMPINTSCRRSSLVLDKETPANRHLDAGSSRGSPLRKQNSASSLQSEGQARVGQLTMPRCRRSESHPQPDPLVVSLVQAIVQTGVPLSEAKFFEGLLFRPLSGRRLLPSVAQLHRNILPVLGQRHESALQRALQHCDAFVFLHEATTGDGRAALGISVLPLDRTGQSPLLIGVEFLEQLNHASVARAVAHVLSERRVLFHRVLAVVTSGTAHMIQAFAANGILGAVLPNALHVPCLLHQLELMIELWPDRLEKLPTVLRLFEETFGRRAALRHRYERFLQERNSELSLPVLSVSGCPGSWMERATAIINHLPVLMEFMATDEEEGAVMAKLQAFLGEGNEELMAEATFVAEHGGMVLNVVRFLHKAGEPLAHRIYAELDNLRIAFSYHLGRGFDPNTNSHLALCQPHVRERFSGILTCSLTRLEHLLNSHPAMPTLRAVRVFDPKQLGAVGWNQIEEEREIPGLTEVPEMELFRYQCLAEAVPADVSLLQWWEAHADQLPTLTPLAHHYLWLPLCSPKSPFFPGDVIKRPGTELSFSDDTARLLCMLKYNRNFR